MPHSVAKKKKKQRRRTVWSPRQGVVNSSGDQREMPAGKRSGWGESAEAKDLSLAVRGIPLISLVKDVMILYVVQMRY